MFYRELFWDGRANHRFNGLDPFGMTGNASGSLTDLDNGGTPTLGAVVDFYDRGGDFTDASKASRIVKLSLSAVDRAALVDFLAEGLTDGRVEMQRAPFDHPSLAVVDGPMLPAVGAGGLGPCP